MQLFDPTTILAAEPSAGGAEIGQVLLATFLISGAYGALALLVIRHRSGKGGLLGRAADAAGELTGLPHWAALPLGIALVSLVVALVGMYWDISLHIDQGRDAGPLANIAHYPILLGLMGIFASGWLAMFLPRPGERPGPAPIRFGKDWYAPIGGILIFLCGGFALVAFPLDDVWHRIFGQDVTLWGPTHLMLLGGAGMTLIGQGVLLTEARWTQRHSGSDATEGKRLGRGLVTARQIGIAGGLLIGVSVYQAEFDFGVPQFRMVFEPAMLALAAGFALTAARIWIGRGGALAALAFFTVIRGAVSLFVGPVIGETTPMLPLYLAEALSVELLALVLGTARPLRLGVAAGVVAGTVGFWAQWGWSQLVMPVPWTGDILPEGIAMALAAGVAGGTLGALLATGLKGELPRPALARGAFAASLAALGIVIANGLLTEEPRDVRAEMTISPSSGGEKADVAVRFDPGSFADGASWANVTSWQGGGLELTELERGVELERGDDGVWRTAEPVPVSGDWKSIVRVHNDRMLAAVPVFLPRDDAIPAPEVPADPAVTREVTTDKAVLQREVKTDVPGWAWTAATGLVGALYLGFILALGWGVGRIGRAQSSGTAPEAAAERGSGLARLSTASL